MQTGALPRARCPQILKEFSAQATVSLQGPARILQRRLEPSKEMLFSAAEVAGVRQQFFSALGALEAPSDAWVVGPTALS